MSMCAHGAIFLCGHAIPSETTKHRAIQNDKYYLKHLDKSLDEILGRFQPEFVLYQSGVDVLKSDKLGKLGLTQDGVKSRDAMVLNFVAGLNVPMVAAMGGGYSKDIKVIVDGHASLFRQIQRDFF